jgi:hypothetical protein
MEQQEEAKNSAPNLEVKVSEDRLAVSVLGTGTDLAHADSARMLLTQMATAGITITLNADQIQEKLSTATAEEDELIEIPLFTGTPPTDPIPGEIKWSGEFFTSGYEMNELTGAVDYRKPRAQRTVDADQRLAEIIPPVEGKPGVDVYGQPVPPPPPEAVFLEAGENVRFDPATRQYFSTIPGRIACDQGILRIDTVYEVHGNVGLASGDITHIGTLVIDGDVESGATVKATGDVEVHGMVDHAHVECGGNLMVSGGIVGDGSVRIDVGGDLHASYLANVHVTVKGMVEISREVDNSEVYAVGTIDVGSGRVVGGSLTSEGDIVVGEAGSQASARTLLQAGANNAYLKEYGQIEEAIATYAKGLKKIRQVTDPMRLRIKSLPQQKREQLAVLLTKVTQLEEKRQLLKEKAEETLEAYRRTNKSHVRCMQRIHPEVVFAIGRYKKRVRESVPFPAKAVMKDGDIAVIRD